MKILHISKYYPPYRGGIEDVCYNIVCALHDKKQKVICFNNSPKDETSTINNVEIIRIGKRIDFKSQPISIRYYYKLKEIIREYQPDIIHLHLPNPLICLYVSLLIQPYTKLIVHWHSDIIAQKYIYPLISPIEKKILSRADSIWVTSPQYLENSIPLLQYKKKAIVVPNPISLEKLQMAKEDYDKVYQIKEQYSPKQIVFFMGRHVEYKGIEYLIEAEKYIKSDCIILIAGQGPLTQHLKNITKSSRIKYIGKIADEEIKIYMHAASVFAFPSITKNEAFGVVLAEAMYCKAVPVCFTIKGSGVNWVNINNKTGIEIENKNAIAFAKAIDDLLINEELRFKLGEQAKQRVVNMFTMKTIAKQINNIYKELQNGN